jgi:hypothetical protein
VHWTVTAAVLVAAAPGHLAGQDPQQMEFQFALWIREMVREVIRREFDVALSVVSVGRLLRKARDVAAAAPAPRLLAGS